MPAVDVLSVSFVQIMKSIIAFVLLAAFSALGDEPPSGQFTNIELLPAPKGSTIVLYGPISTANMLDKLNEAGSWQKLLEKHGVTFPKGGYVLYDNLTRTIIAATTPDQHKLIYTMLYPQVHGGFERTGRTHSVAKRNKRTVT